MKKIVAVFGFMCASISWEAQAGSARIQSFHAPRPPVMNVHVPHIHARHVTTPHHILHPVVIAHPQPVNRVIRHYPTHIVHQPVFPRPQHNPGEWYSKHQQKNYVNMPKHGAPRVTTPVLPQPLVHNPQTHKPHIHKIEFTAPRIHKPFSS